MRRRGDVVRRCGRSPVRSVVALLGATAMLAGLLAVDVGPAAADTHVTPGPIETMYDQAGPWEDITSEELDDHTIVFPTDLGTDARDPLDGDEHRHPIVVFGVGTGSHPSAYLTLLEYWATWGYVTIAPNLPATGTGVEMWAAVEHLVEEDEDPDSVFHDRLDTARIAAAGHSQGAGGALWAAVHADGAITSVVSVAVADPVWWRGGAGGVIAVPPPDLSELVAPIFFLRGTGDGFATEPAAIDWFADAGGPAFKTSIVGEGHLFDQVPEVPGYAYQLAWLEYTLLDDPHACRLFREADGVAAELAGHPLLTHLDHKDLPECAPLPDEPQEPDEPFEHCEAPCDLDQIVEVDVEAGVLTMEQGASTVSLETITLDGAPQAASGVLNEVTVTNLRGDGAAWSVTGQVSDFQAEPTLVDCPADDDSTWDRRCIPGDNLGWAPLAALAHTPVPGDVAEVVAGPELAGLVPMGLGSTPRLLCAAPATKSGGTFRCGAILTLTTPASASADTYSAILTLTLA